MNILRSKASYFRMGRGAPGNRAAVLAVCALLAAGCGGKAAQKGEAPPPAPSGPLVAVAPLENKSNDLDAQDIVRGAFVEELRRSGWNVMPPAESDRLLREGLGISYGGQLPATTPAEVCDAAGVSGVFYGEVTEWSKTTTGIFNSVSVVVAFSLYGRDGTLLWTGGDRQAQQNVPRGGGSFGAQILAHGIMNLVANPMTPHGKRAGANAARKVPADLHWKLPAVPAGPKDAPTGGREPAGEDSPPKTGGTR